MITRLIIARHGNTFGPADIVTRVGITDLPLVATGLEQGRKLGVHLKEHAMIPDIIYTSQLQRTQQTATQAQEMMHINLPLNTLAIFNEIDYGPDENQPEERVKKRIGEQALQAWENSAIVPEGWNVHPDIIIQNWQTFAAFLRREHSGKTILVVTSNGIARFSPYLTGDFAGFSKQHKIKIATGALCVFENDNGEEKWRCTEWNLRPGTT